MSEIFGVQYNNPHSSEEFTKAYGAINIVELADSLLGEQHLNKVKQEALRPIHAVQAGVEANMVEFIKQGSSLVAVSTVSPYERTQEANKYDQALGYLALRIIPGNRYGSLSTLYEISDAYVRDFTTVNGRIIEQQNQGHGLALLHYAVSQLSISSFIRVSNIPNLGEEQNKKMLATLTRLGLADGILSSSDRRIWLHSIQHDRDSFIERLEAQYPWLGQSVTLGGPSQDDIPEKTYPNNPEFRDNVVPHSVFKAMQDKRAARKASSQT